MNSYLNSTKFVILLGESLEKHPPGTTLNIVKNRWHFIASLIFTSEVANSKYAIQSTRTNLPLYESNCDIINFVGDRISAISMENALINYVQCFFTLWDMFSGLGLINC